MIFFGLIILRYSPTAPSIGTKVDTMPTWVGNQGRTKPIPIHTSPHLEPKSEKIRKNVQSSCSVSAKSFDQPLPQPGIQDKIKLDCKYLDVKSKASHLSSSSSLTSSASSSSSLSYLLPAPAVEAEKKKEESLFVAGARLEAADLSTPRRYETQTSEKVLTSGKQEVLLLSSQNTVVI